MNNDSNQYSARECDFGEFEDLSIDKKQKLLKMIARIMERAYRRGVQQGISMYVDGRCKLQKDDLATWRYFTDLDKSDGIAPGYSTTSLERLSMEEDCLREVGLGEGFPGKFRVILNKPA